MGQKENDTKARRVTNALGIRLASENLGIHQAPADIEARKKRQLQEQQGQAEIKRKNSLIEKMKRQARSDVHTLGIIGKNVAIKTGKEAWKWFNTPIPAQKKKPYVTEPIFTGKIKW
jgi:hypothetical protein